MHCQAHASSNKPNKEFFNRLGGFLRLAGSFIQRLKKENFRSSYLLVPEIKVLHTRSFHRLIRRF